MNDVFSNSAICTYIITSSLLLTTEISVERKARNILWLCSEKWSKQPQWVEFSGGMKGNLYSATTEMRFLSTVEKVSIKERQVVGGTVVCIRRNPSVVKIIYEVREVLGSQIDASIFTNSSWKVTSTEDRNSGGTEHERVRLKTLRTGRSALQVPWYRNPIYSYRFIKQS